LKEVKAFNLDRMQLICDRSSIDAKKWVATMCGGRNNLFQLYNKHTAQPNTNVEFVTTKLARAAHQ